MSGFIQSGRFGGAAFAPTNIAGLIAWYDASDTATITSSAGAVSQWNDKSGNGYHASQATAGNKPTTASVTINSLNALSYDGNDNLEAAVPSQTLKPSTVFVVSHPTAGGDKTYVCINVSGGYQLRSDPTGATQLVSAGIALIGTSTNPSSTAAASVMSTSYSAAGVYAFHLNGAANGTATNDITLNAHTRLDVGSSAGANFFLGKLGEVVVYNSVLSTTDRQSVESYLKSKWGTP